MKILISNDDGINAPGIEALAAAMATLGDIVVAAPDRNRSGASNSLTLTNPLRVREIKPNWFSIEGTPTDCVHLAITGLMDGDPDMVVSGINHGANMGDDVLYSGTVAAAIEGRSLGLPSLAFSLARHSPMHYATAAEVAKQLVARLMVSPLPASTILNINIPDVPFSELRGYEITRFGSRHRAEPTIKEIDPRGETIYWIGLPGKEQDAGPGSDFHAILNNKVSITPLNLDWTAYKAFDQLSTWISDLQDFTGKK
jgi:5'-nucleotidase